MKKILSILLLVMFVISFASAFEFDNMKVYDSITREMTVTNAFGLGQDIGKVRLNTPLVFKVGLGYQKVAEIDIESYEDYSDVLKDFTFIDLKSGESVKKNIDLKYKTYETVEIDDYTTICNLEQNILYSEEINETKNCERIKIGSHKEQRIKWVNIKDVTLKKDDKLTIGIFTNVAEGDHIDWSPIIFGVRVSHDIWAEWKASLNTNLKYYYKLDETSGTSAYDSLGVLNLTESGSSSTPNHTGKISQAWDFVENGDSLVSSANTGINGSSTFSKTIFKFFFFEMLCCLLAISSTLSSKIFFNLKI